MWAALKLVSPYPVAWSQGPKSKESLLILSEVGGAAEAGGTRVPWDHQGWG